MTRVISFPIAERISDHQLLLFDTSFTTSEAGRTCATMPDKIIPERSAAILAIDITQMITFALGEPLLENAENYGRTSRSIAVSVRDGEAVLLVHSDQSVNLFHRPHEGEEIAIRCPFRLSRDLQPEDFPFLGSEACANVGLSRSMPAARLVGHSLPYGNLYDPWCDQWDDGSSAREANNFCQAVAAALSLTGNVPPDHGLLVELIARQFLPDGSLTAPFIQLSTRAHGSQNWQLLSLPDHLQEAIDRALIEHLPASSLIHQEWCPDPSDPDATTLLAVTAACHSSDEPSRLTAHQYMASARSIFGERAVQGLYQAA